jgi:hypothetical protein
VELACEKMQHLTKVELNHPSNETKVNELERKYSENLKTKHLKTGYIQKRTN